MYPAISDGITFLNLNGITDSKYNEIGIVENGDELFIAAVFTNDGTASMSAAAVQNYMKMVVDTLKTTIQ